MKQISTLKIRDISCSCNEWKCQIYSNLQDDALNIFVWETFSWLIDVEAFLKIILRIPPVAKYSTQY